MKNIFLVIGLLLALNVEAKMLKEGDFAPDFVLMNEDNNEVALSDYKKKNIALYFYPMDGTYGCTKQACSLRDGFSELQDAGIVILGISSDSVKSHQKFKQKNRLPFTLLSDVGQKVAALYGVARGFLFSWLGAKRITFLINKKGIIIAVLKDIELKDHSSQIIKAFKEYKSKV